MDPNIDYTNQIQILHFSDIHFGKNHICNPEDPSGSPDGIESLAERIIKDLNNGKWTKQQSTTSLYESSESSGEAIIREEILNKKRQSNTPLFLTITGDFTETAKQVEFDQAMHFVNSFIGPDILGKSLDKKHVFMIPGNHDVKFIESDVRTRFEPYCAFYNEFFNEVRKPIQPFEAINFSQVHTLEIPNEVTGKDSKIIIAEINCCMYVEKDTVDSSRGQVSSAGIARLRQQLTALASRADYNDYIKIALIHHHVLLLPSFIEYGKGIDAVVNARILLQLLSEFNFHAILHGHKHYPQIFSYDPVSSWIEDEPKMPQLIIAGGSCGSRELTTDAAKACNTYSLITIKWHPNAYQARIKIETRGLTRRNGHGRLSPDQWTWDTVNITDKKIAPYEFLPKIRQTRKVRYDPLDDSLRKAEYERLRFWLPVAEVMPSLIVGQAYEVNAWLVEHKPELNSTPRLVQVEWSCGKLFTKQIVTADNNPTFSVSFHYWGPMLIQSKLIFEDGYTAFSYIYSRMPQKPE